MGNSFSMPMPIPDRIQEGGSLSQSPPMSPLGSLPMSIHLQVIYTSLTGNIYLTYR